MNRTFMALMSAVIAMPLAAQARSGDTRTDTTTIERTEVTEDTQSWRDPTFGVMADVGVSDY